ncbi:type II toxin-antitoxin system RelE/ParE family toxin [Cyanobium sp. Morenito 9A2]|uniref:type II toxin-antitoxin system RelE family toxin n=1 Tax=Cyanobium sp. Morenito 9A2 TaxID=2823718 RepID=UPI0020CF5A37|nr:type II toxin-antitoxin system RelE/ParE family toxin [Cyanobium sp. Morenito 9A2]MCP9850759.1 type II toxin-antitoxin system RelE/ParE family toxin [Cyanobium sp. Morenito 9A2]
MAEYSLSIKPSAAKELQVISDKATLARLIEKIKSLATQPRPSGSEKLAGRQSLYRVRQGNYRVIYSVNDEMRIVDVVKVGHRRDVYR